MLIFPYHALKPPDNFPSSAELTHEQRGMQAVYGSKNEESVRTCWQQDFQRQDLTGVQEQEFHHNVVSREKKKGTISHRQGFRVAKWSLLAKN